MGVGKSFLCFLRAAWRRRDFFTDVGFSNFHLDEENGDGTSLGSGSKARTENLDLQ